MSGVCSCSYYSATLVCRSSYCPESITKTWAMVSLEEEEDGGLDLSDYVPDNQFIDPKWFLVGRLFTDKLINFNALKNTLASIWRPNSGMFVQKLPEFREQMFVFQFFHEIDIRRVEENGPWSFENNLLVLKRFGPYDSPTNIAIHTTEFWIQIHNLPMDFMSEAIVCTIGNYIGSFVLLDPNNFTGVWRSFCRIRVTIDVRKPLKQGMKLKQQGGDWMWVDFKYERLPIFCFLCGKLGHMDKFCEKRYEEGHEDHVRPYGIWLKAVPRKFQTQIGERWLRNEAPATEEQEGPTVRTSPVVMDGFGRNNQAKESDGVNGTNCGTVSSTGAALKGPNMEGGRGDIYVRDFGEENLGTIEAEEEGSLVITGELTKEAASSSGSLIGRVAIVTGASRGIGRAISAHLRSLGAKVVLNYASSSTQADLIASELNTLSPSSHPVAVAIRADVSDPEQVKQLFDKAEQEFSSKIHILVNCAGVMDPKYPTLANTTVDDWDTAFNVNTKGAFLCCREAANRLINGGGGRIINISTSVVGANFPGYAAYAASKAAVETMTKILAKELKGTGITANCVAPGPVATELFFAGKTEEMVKRIADSGPLGRLGQPKDISEIVGFLASDAGEWINGQVIRANGGFIV
ncbi:uncharacterized protein LOC126664459 [Mercurialis annua]|uniref:uncharacterized protein LOC126664459 n=1 Tax=Mercurialis annua TaxID=3986 RepID=UPI00215F88B0|nr:uncharacterized protein LOC126664459 [Mercurialis annua]